MCAIAGVQGRTYGLIKQIPPRYRMALAVVMGPHMDSIIVDSEVCHNLGLLRVALALLTGRSAIELTSCSTGAACQCSSALQESPGCCHGPPHGPHHRRL